MRNRIVACKNSLTKLYCKFEEEKERDIHKYFRIIYFIYGKKDINISLLDKYICIYTHSLEVSLASIFDRGFLSPLPNQTFQPQNLYNRLYNKRERKRRRKKNRTKILDSVGHVSSSEKERVKKREREKE